MTHATTETDFGKETDTWSVLEQTLREGARRMLQQALELEVTEYLEKYSGQRDDNGKRMVVKNGYHPKRDLVTGVGPIGVKAPRIDDRKLDPERTNPFNSSILPRYMRKIPSIDNLIPVLYLKGLSTNGFGDALASILGEGAKGLSAVNIVRLKKGWEDDFKQWESRKLEGTLLRHFFVRPAICWGGFYPGRRLLSPASRLGRQGLLCPPWCRPRSRLSQPARRCQRKRRRILPECLSYESHVRS